MTYKLPTGEMEWSRNKRYKNLWKNFIMDMSLKRMWITQKKLKKKTFYYLLCPEKLIPNIPIEER